jgi:hypothetical protein
VTTDMLRSLVASRLQMGADSQADAQRHMDSAPCVAYARELTYWQGWTDALAPVVLWLKEHADSDTANAEHQARVLPSPECSGSALNGGTK